MRLSVVVGTVPPMAAGEQRWNPWRALRARARTTLVWQAFAGAERAGCAVDADGAEVVLLDPRLGRVARNAALGHELVHLERGLLAPETPPAIVQREEHQVAAECARRLVPLEELAGFVAATADVEPVTAAVVADAFEVPFDVAERALAQLRHPRSASLRQPPAPGVHEGAA